MNTLKVYITSICLSAILLSVFSSCGKEDGPDVPGVKDETYQPVKLTPVSGLRLSWDYSTLVKLADKGKSPKMVRMSGERIIAVYESDNSIYAITSDDNGATWDSPFVVFGRATHQGKHGDASITYTNLMVDPDIVRLSNGSMLVACGVHYKYTVEDIATEFPAAILTRRLSAEGTWESIQQVYSNVGCESPSLLELPDGVLQLYFANSTTSETIEMLSTTGLPVLFGEQQVEMIHSIDGGQTWSSSIAEFGPDGIEKKWAGSKTIVYRSGKINNAPSVALLGERILLAYGDNNNVTFKPYIARTSSVSSWPYPINGESPNREYAFYEILPEKYYMGRPHVITLPSGQSLLSYETSAGRADDYETLEVAISDKNGINFTKATRPLSARPNVRSVMNSLMLLDDNTVVALTSSNHGDLTNDAPWYLKGYLVDDLTVSEATVTSYPLFVGGLSEANVRVGLGIDDSNLYIEARATDATPVQAGAGSWNGDGIYVYIDAANLSLLDVDTGIYKFWISSVGDVTRWDGKEGEWKPAVSGGIYVDVVDVEGGYSLSITIPKSALPSFNNSGIRFGLGLSDYTSAGVGTVELLSRCMDLRSSSWLGITF